MTSGNLVPTSAALIKESTVIEFTRPDWGLPGVAMPRIVIYGPYPTATAAVNAALGTLALPHLPGRPRSPALAFFPLEAPVFLTPALTPTPSLLAGLPPGPQAPNSLVLGTG